MTDLLNITPPHDLAAELILAGSAFVHEEDLDVVPDIHGGMFYDSTFHVVFDACRTLHENQEGVSILSVSSLLRKRGLLDGLNYNDREGIDALKEIRKSVPTSAAIKSMGILVARAYALRTLSDRFARAALEARQEKVDDLTQWMGDILATADGVLGHNIPDAKGTKQRTRELKGVLDDERKSPGKFHGPHTGLKFLDDFLPRGLEPGRMIVICGRPGTGKSTLSDQIGEAAARSGTPSLMFSLEMPGEENTRRELCRRSGIESHVLASGDPGIEGTIDYAIERTLWEMEQAENGMAELFIDERRRSLIAIQSYVRLMRRRHNVGLVIIDHMGLVQHGDAKWSDVRRVSEIAIAIKAMAMQEMVPIIAVSQLNRNVEYRSNSGGDRRPQLTDLRSSGEIEQSADVVIAVWSPARKDDNTPPSYGEALFLKNRSGRTGMMCYEFKPSIFSFHDTNQERAKREIKEYLQAAKEESGRPVDMK